jgi:serpin B
MHYTRAIFPEYKADYDDDISDILKNDLGIRTIFDENRSDFSGITDTPAYCSKVIHKCSLDVNRKGIEGAAVTIVALDGTSGPLEEYEKVYHDFVVNRAFGFVITDSYGAVLFSGVVNGI